MMYVMCTSYLIKIVYKKGKCTAIVLTYIFPFLYYIFARLAVISVKRLPVISVIKCGFCRKSDEHSCAPVRFGFDAQRM